VRTLTKRSSHADTSPVKCSNAGVNARTNSTLDPYTVAARALQEQGFDLCYDKRLYDRLVHYSPELVREHVQADAGYQDGLIGFIENHEKPRAVVMSTLQGARLYHDGQLEGRRKRIPIQLGRMSRPSAIYARSTVACCAP
jgi:hypothetical protein